MIIVGLDSPEGLAEARNTSVAVDLKSMEELRKSFNTLKGILDTCYIDGEHYIDRRAGLDKDASDEMCREEREKLLMQMSGIIPDIFLLWDTIERRFTEASEQIGKRYGRKKYSNYDKDQRPPALFSNAQIEYSVPRGILYPLVGAFRALVKVDENGRYYWAVPPLRAWEDTKADLVASALATSEELSNNPANIGRSQNLWSTLFMTMYVYALENQEMGIGRD